MIELSPEASEQVHALEHFYIGKQRPQALRNVSHTLAEARSNRVDTRVKHGHDEIPASRTTGQPRVKHGHDEISASRTTGQQWAPRPYPQLAVFGLFWLKRGRDWVAYDPGMPVIAGVFFEADDIPGRIL